VVPAARRCIASYAAEIREAQMRLALTNDGTAQMLGIDVRTARRRAAGAQIAPEPAARPLRFMLATHMRAEQVLALLRAEPRRQSFSWRGRFFAAVAPARTASRRAS
jgi:hypothetical protein